MSLIKRMENIQRFLEEKKIDILLLDDSISLYYLTNLHLSSGIFLISKHESCLLVDGRYLAVASLECPYPVKPLEENIILEFFNEHGANLDKKIAFDSQNTSYKSYLKLQKLVDNLKEEKKVINFQLIPIDNPLKDFMLIKDSQEISSMKKSANLTWRAFEHICLFLKEGITEIEVALEFEVFCRKNGAESLSFQPIIAFGKNTAFPHHKVSSAKLKENDAILIDIGVVVESYCSDMTRMVFFGDGVTEIEKLYSIVRKAQNKALSICKPGLKIGELDKAAREIMAQDNLESLFVHSLGHGVGLQVHEYPRIKIDGEDKNLTLKPGMVITIEPGLYDPKVGGARYEDMILITQDGYENFFSSV
jgi:Xaa-Pro aminopeptidase